MEKVIAFFRLIRSGNLLIMAITMVFGYYCINDYLLPEDLLNPKFILLLTVTLMTAAAGYIINDYLDVKLDMVNKPSRVIVGKMISRRWAMFLHSGMNTLAVLMSLYVRPSLALTVGLFALLLWFYSTYFKRQFLIGNLVIAFLSASVILVLVFIQPDSASFFTVMYAVFAFFITLIREIIKDAEDVRGDSQFNCRTIPIVLGIRKTKRILLSVNGAFVILLFGYIFLSSSKVANNHAFMAFAYAVYILLLVILPLCIAEYLLYRADTKKHFTRLSTLFKIIMLSGLLSMAFLRF